MVATIVIVRTKNNTQVSLVDDKGKTIWSTTEKRYGRNVNANQYAIEAVVYTAQALGINTFNVEIKGFIALSGVVKTLQVLNVQIQHALIRNRLPLGGFARQPHVRRV